MNLELFNPTLWNIKFTNIEVEKLNTHRHFGGETQDLPTLRWRNSRKLIDDKPKMEKEAKF